MDYWKCPNSSKKNPVWECDFYFFFKDYFITWYLSDNQVCSYIKEFFFSVESHFVFSFLELKNRHQNTDFSQISNMQPYPQKTEPIYAVYKGKEHKVEEITRYL